MSTKQLLGMPSFWHRGRLEMMAEAAWRLDDSIAETGQ